MSVIEMMLFKIRKHKFEAGDPAGGAESQKRCKTDSVLFHCSLTSSEKHMIAIASRLNFICFPSSCSSFLISFFSDLKLKIQALDPCLQGSTGTVVCSALTVNVSDASRRGTTSRPGIR